MRIHLWEFETNNLYMGDFGFTNGDIKMRHTVHQGNALVSHRTVNALSIENNLNIFKIVELMIIERQNEWLCLCVWAFFWAPSRVFIEN